LKNRHRVDEHATGFMQERVGLFILSFCPFCRLRRVGVVIAIVELG